MMSRWRKQKRKSPSQLKNPLSRRSRSENPYALTNQEGSSRRKRKYFQAIYMLLAAPLIALGGSRKCRETFSQRELIMWSDKGAKAFLIGIWCKEVEKQKETAIREKNRWLCSDIRDGKHGTFRSKFLTMADYKNWSRLTFLWYGNLLLWPQ